MGRARLEALDMGSSNPYPREGDMIYNTVLLFPIPERGE